VGITLTLPETDSLRDAPQQMEDDMAYGLGGRAAEESSMAKISTELPTTEQVTKIARLWSALRHGRKNWAWSREERGTVF
jgi:ATP-dependent Zn protease